jgi:hypothetical protein
MEGRVEGRAEATGRPTESGKIGQVNQTFLWKTNECEKEEKVFLLECIDARWVGLVGLLIRISAGKR